MSDFADPGSNKPTIQSMARSARRRFGSGWEAGKRVLFFILLVLIMLVPLNMVEGVIQERAITKAQVEEVLDLDTFQKIMAVAMGNRLTDPNPVEAGV